MIRKEELWAKLNPFESLESHMLKAGRACKGLLTNSSLMHVIDKLYELVVTNLTKQEFINFVCYIVALHDIGKATPFFQAKNNNNMKERMKKDKVYESANENSIRHEQYSSYYFSDYSDCYLGKNHIKDSSLINDIANLLSYHHYKAGKVATEIDSTFWINIVKEFEKEIYIEFNFGEVIYLNISNRFVFYSLLIGVLIVSDWIVSSKQISALSLDEFKSDEEILKWLNYYGFENIRYVFNKLTYKELLDEDKKLRPLQSWSVDYFKSHKPELIFIEAGTGEGKTSVALYSVFQTLKDYEGFYYALPMQIMVNSKYKEIDDFLYTNFKEHAVLLHGNRNLIETNKREYNLIDCLDEDGDRLEVSDFLYSDARQGLLNKYIVGTIDQLLYSILKNKFSVLRLLGLLGKVLVLDEIHAYAVYTSALICKLLEVCKLFNVRVILMSATLTKSLKEKYLNAYSGKVINLKNNGYPLVTVYENEQLSEYIVEGSERNREYELAKVSILGNIKEQAEMVYSSYLARANIIVYKNTVKEAQNIYFTLKEMGVKDIVLCHSRFVAKDRADKEKFVVKLFGKDYSQRPKQYIVVATQVLEACLDLDFDVCFTDIAPIDILAQRLGRVCRFDVCNSGNRGKVTVFTSIDNLYGDSSYIYAELFLRNTEDYLNSKQVLKLPEQLREALDYVYGLSISMSEENILMLFTQKQKETIETQLALSYVVDIWSEEFKTECVDCNVSTRLIDSKTLIVLDKTEDLKYNYDSLTHEDYRELMLHSFSCPRNYLNERFYINKGKLKGNYLLTMDSGLYIDESKQYSYSTEKGFMVEKL